MIGSKDHIDYKRLFRLVILVFALGLVLFYKVLLSDTLSYTDQLRQIKAQSGSNYLFDNRISDLRHRIKLIDSQIGDNEKSESVLRNLIVSQTLELCENLKLRVIAVNDSHRSKQGNYTIVTNSIVLEGNFQNLLKYVYEIDYGFQESKLVSVSFQIEKNKINRNNELHAIVYFQNAYEEV